ncbi:MAG: FAD-binding domain-containing protein [Candidatus Nanohaloarchaea archaeon]
MKAVWHRNDLRLMDNRALDAAGEGAAPVYVVDEGWWDSEMVSPARKKFVLECLEDLDRRYRSRGSSLTVLEGEPLEVLEDLEHDIYFSQDMNVLDRDQEKEARKRFMSVPKGVVRPGKNSRQNWSERVDEYFSSEMLRPPEELSELEREGIELHKIRDKIGKPGKESFGEGGAKAGRRRLESFLEDIEQYPGCISPPDRAESGTSHLSPYLRHGAISPREAHQRAETRKEDAPGGVEMFQERLVWHQHFRQKIEDNPELPEEAINPVYRDLHRHQRDDELVESWKNGETGYPLVDASMRALKQTGWLNFRMRAMCASFFSYILKQWWKIGADHFFKHLIDADVAINYYQWQMQSGLVGVHANRIYDPVKQVRENDPEGRFIGKYVPELEDVPEEFLAEPWKMPEELQEETGTVIGRDYPEPVVNYQREASKARDFFDSKASQAYSAFRDDEVWRKASLSSRHSRQQILEKANSVQKDLEQFGT